MPAREFQHRILLQIGLLLRHDQHAHAGDDQEDAEDVQHPAEFPHHPGAGQDHDGAHDDGAQHAVDQHPALVFGGDVEGREDQQEDEHVVHRQRLLDQIAGEEFQRLAVGDLRPGRAAQIPPQAGIEQQRQADPDQRPGGRLLDADLVRLAAAEHEQVERQHDQHEGDEGGPHPGFADGDRVIHLRLR